MLTRWSVGTLRIFSNIFWLIIIFDSPTSTFGPVLLWKFHFWFSSSMIIQYYLLFNTKVLPQWYCFWLLPSRFYSRYHRAQKSLVPKVTIGHKSQCLERSSAQRSSTSKVIWSRGHWPKRSSGKKVVAPKVLGF